ncbi:MAG: hypothetical protein MHMPM18_000508 [Marteilia pararefringens]
MTSSSPPSLPQRSKARSKSLLQNGADHDTVLSVTRPGRQKSVSFTKYDNKQVKTESMECEVELSKNDCRINIQEMSHSVTTSVRHESFKSQNSTEWPKEPPADNPHNRSEKPLSFKEIFGQIEDSFKQISRINVSITHDELLYTEKEGVKGELLDVKLFAAITLKKFDHLSLSVADRELEFDFQKFTIILNWNANLLEDRYCFPNSKISSVQLVFKEQLDSKDSLCHQDILAQIIERFKQLNIESMSNLQALKYIAVFSGYITDLLIRLEFALCSNQKCFGKVIDSVILDEKLRFCAKN